MRVAAKEFLSQAIDLEVQIQSNMMEIERIRSIGEKITSTITSDRVEGGDTGSRVEEAALKLDELKNELSEDINRLLTVRKLIRVAINMLESPYQRSILTLRYIQGKKWENICVEVGYEWAQTHRLHKKALEIIDEGIKNNKVET